MGVAACLWNTVLLEQGLPVGLLQLRDCKATSNFHFYLFTQVKETILFDTCF